MNVPGLEDHLHDLADQVAAPATDAARRAIGRRARVLRRRRQVRNTAAAGLLATAVVAGALALRGHPADVELGPARPGADGALPALTLDLAGWDIVQAQELPPDQAAVEDAATEGTLQVFRRPGDLVGPTVFVRHTPASDAVVPVGGEYEAVAVAGSTGYLSSPGPDTMELSWNALGDSMVSVQSWKLSRAELLAFAGSLQARDEDGNIQYPARPEDRFGFTAGEAPGGIEEVSVPSAGVEPSDIREVQLARGNELVVLQTRRGNEHDFEASLEGILGDGEVTRVRVMDREAVLVHHADERLWVMVWRPDDHTVAYMAATDVDQSSIDEVIASIRELPEEDWRSRLEAPGTSP